MRPAPSLLLVLCALACNRALPPAAGGSPDAGVAVDAASAADVEAAPVDATLTFSDAVPQVPPGILLVECIGGGEGHWGFAFDKWCTPRAAADAGTVEAYCHGIPLDRKQLRILVKRPELLQPGATLSVGQNAEDAVEVSVVRDWTPEADYVADRGFVLIDGFARRDKGFSLQGRLKDLEFAAVGYATGRCRVVSTDFDTH